MDDEFLLLTPEKVVVRYRISGLAGRVGAHVVDLLLALVATILPVVLVASATPVIGDAAAGFVGSLLALVVLLAYFVLFEYFWQGQTPGKRMAKMRVMMLDGTPVTFVAALYRNLLRPADMLPFFYLVGLLSVFTNQRSQRLGDLAAGTVVVVERSPALGFTPAPHHVGVHRFESTVGDLAKVSLEEYQVLKQLRDRFPWLPVQTQEWSMRNIWTPFAERHDIAPLEGVHPVYQMEAVIMKFGRLHNLI